MSKMCSSSKKSGKGNTSSIGVTKFHLEELHDNMYKNIEVLTNVHPPCEGFLEIFNDRMFLRESNYAAFHQVIYYLLKILTNGAGSIQEYISIWPIYEKKAEQNFKREIVACVNSFADKHEHLRIQKVQLFTIMSPSGAKFLQFMHSLTIALLLKVAKEMDCTIIPFEGNENSIPIDKLINKERKQLLEAKNEYVEVKNSYIEKLENVRLINKKLGEDCYDLEKQLEVMNNEASVDDNLCLNLDIELTQLIEELKKCEILHSDLECLEKLCINLKNKANLLESNEEKMEDLIELYEKMSLKIGNLNKIQKEEMNESFLKSSADYLEKLNELKKKLMEVFEAEKVLSNKLILKF